MVLVYCKTFGNFDLSFCLFFFNIYLFNLFFIFGCVGSQLRHAGSQLRHAGSFIAVHRLRSSCGVYTPQLSFSLSSCGTWVFSLQLWHTGSRAHGLCSLQHAGSLVEMCGLSSCGSWAYQLPCGMRDLSSPVACGILVPRPGIEPASPALQDGFFTTGPPGKSQFVFF